MLNKYLPGVELWTSISGAERFITQRSDGSSDGDRVMYDVTWRQPGGAAAASCWVRVWAWCIGRVTAVYFYEETYCRCAAALTNDGRCMCE